MHSNALPTRVVQSSGSMRSAMAVEPAMSAKSTVIGRRSLEAVGRAGEAASAGTIMFRILSPSRRSRRRRSRSPADHADGTITQVASTGLPSEVSRLVGGFRAFQLVVTACRLNLPDLLATGPKSADELAAATGTNAPAMRKLLRGLAACRVFKEQPDGCFAVTDISEHFRADKPGVRTMTPMLSEEAYDAWGELTYTIQTGKPAYDRVHGKGRWEDLAERPEAAALFNAAMVELTNTVAKDFVATYDLANASTVVDIGGGTGALLAGVLKANPHLKGILFDLAPGLAGARDAMAAEGLDSRVTLVEGNFFESVPPGADVYLLKSIVHDWDDEHASAILKTCRTAM